ncbi:putative carboxylesterase [Durotheca rogersii]|uniref:putative carboxylesterase n=1 Tax=Durotheca rogersii TaxID=419775 RepID=UPI00221F2814|nr:putative carboxylesterase [Durotheca rogersii]KAI5861611.1 putative carboxylesterase [Durotheca rogersii]
MQRMKSSSNICAWFILVAAGQAIYALSCALPAAPTVDLGYATYRGYYNDTYDINVWKSVRYAAPPVGELRWQTPQPPLWDNGQITPAVDQPPLCPQSGAFGVPKAYGFNSGPGNEDCLYLNVYAAPNASSLPVLVWIHGGGHSVFGAQYDPSVWINANENGFIVVEIQYRLGAFGYLASPDIKAAGQLNAGLLDQRYALQWVQQYISKFGGDPGRVTVGGESSGAGSALHHAFAYGGNDLDLFENVIAASPYLPPVHRYDDAVPTAHYNEFVKLAGCGQDSLARSNYPSTFACLVAADSVVLQNASGTVSTTQGYFGSFAFVPVVDDDYIQGLPSIQSLTGRVNGKRLLLGTNANEGVPLTNPQVDTREKYDDFISETFPLLTPEDVSSLNGVYQIESLPPDDGILFDTLGISGPTALHKSGIASGIQQAVFNIAAENTFHCPAGWLAEAFNGNDSRRVWRYQYSVTPAYHGADISAYFAHAATRVPSPDFRRAVQKIWGGFVTRGTPVISVADATAGLANATAPVRDGSGDIDWPPFRPGEPLLLNLNTTGGVVDVVTVPPYLKYYVRTGPGIVNTFSLADAEAWEGGRGTRCQFWRRVAERVPQ